MTVDLVLDSSITSLNIYLVGVGGQGTILASDVLVSVGVRFGLDVKKAEVHGMSQRGGSVVSQVRLGKQVFSPIINRGEVDVFLAFEKLEAIRYIDYLRPGGLALINNTKIIPVTAHSGVAYPSEEIIHAGLAKVTDNIHLIDGDQIAGKLGNPRAANMVVLGALSALLKSNPDTWIETMREKVPEKYADLNQHAFLEGRSAVTLT